MTKLVNYIILALVLILLVLLVENYVQRNTIAKQDVEITRLARNQGELLDTNYSLTRLTLKQKEFITYLDDSLRKTLLQLKIKPKTVTKVEERVIIQKITDTVKVSVKPLTKDTFLISDEGPCFVWEGIFNTEGNSVRRINFSYQNKSTDIFHKVPKRMLLGFIPIGRKIVWTSKTQCGAEQTKIIEITK